MASNRAISLEETKNETIDLTTRTSSTWLQSLVNYECDRINLADVDALAITIKRALATYGIATLREMI
ncbi:hypothetical protein AAG906_040615 [Vitis piasezkii]